MYVNKPKMKMKLLIYLSLSILNRYIAAEISITSMDNTFFSIDWPASDKLKEDIHDESFVVTSSSNEKYYCVLPTVIRTGEEKESSTYLGPQEYELLSPLFQQTACSYRIESYWTYELCHAKHLRQYHEDKELKQGKSKLQEYFLGRFDSSKDKAAYMKDLGPIKAENGEEIVVTSSVPVLRFDNVDYPYFQMNFTDGTICDVTGQPRSTHIKYICHEDGRGEMLEIKETSSCEYDTVVLTSQLCDHPAYQLKSHYVNKIKCHAMDGSPRKPVAMNTFMDDPSNSPVISRSARAKIFYKKSGGETDVVTRYYSEPATDKQDSLPKTSTKSDVKTQTQTDSKRYVTNSARSLPTTDKSLVREFLTGDYCITGGTGWWKHEFCFNKIVNQYHEEKNKVKLNIVLGQWNKESHLAWLRDNPSRRPKSSVLRKYISHFYTNGDLCDITKKPRTVEVKLKCQENPQHPQSVSIYLVEPSTCNYILVVESPVMCPIVQAADENALIDDYLHSVVTEKP